MAHFVTEMSNLVEHQMASSGHLVLFLVLNTAFGRQGIDKNHEEYKFLKVERLWDKWGAFTEGPVVNAPHLSVIVPLAPIYPLGSNQCPCLSKAEFNTRNESKLLFSMGRRFDVQLDYQYLSKSVSSDEIYV